MQLIVSTNNSTGFSAYIDQATGNAYLSDTLICSLTGIHHETLEKIISNCSVRDFTSEAVQVLTEIGVRSVRGLRQASDLKLVIRAWKPANKASKERKEKLIDALIDAGATAYIYSLCGYTMQQNVPQETIAKANPALSAAKDIEEIQYLMRSNPRLAQLLVDSTINFYIGDQLAIASAQSVPLLGVVEIAHSEGFKTDLSSRVKLGKFVKGLVGHLAQVEKRLVNGTWQEVNCYPDCEEVRNVVRSFFS